MERQTVSYYAGFKHCNLIILECTGDDGSAGRPGFSFGVQNEILGFALLRIFKTISKDYLRARHPSIMSN